LKHTAPTIGLSPSQLLPRGLRGGATAHIRGSGGTDLMLSYWWMA
jgi:hypothetical protein